MQEVTVKQAENSIPRECEKREFRQHISNGLSEKEALKQVCLDFLKNEEGELTTEATQLLATLNPYCDRFMEYTAIKNQELIDYIEKM